MVRGGGKMRGKGGRGRGRGRGRIMPASSACVSNSTDLSRRVEALPSYFLRHWPPRSIDFKTAQSTYENLAAWGRTRFQIVDGQLYYPDLKHNTFGCVVRRRPHRLLRLTSLQAWWTIIVWATESRARSSGEPPS